MLLNALKEINKIKDYRGNRNSTDPKSIFKKKLEEYVSIKEGLDTEYNPYINIITAICNVLIEVINVAYNCTYALMTSKDKCIIEADGKLRFTGNQFVLQITSIFSRKYSIVNGRMIVVEGTERQIL